MKVILCLECVLKVIHEAEIGRPCYLGEREKPRKRTRGINTLSTYLGTASGHQRYLSI